MIKKKTVKPLRLQKETLNHIQLGTVSGGTASGCWSKTIICGYTRIVMCDV